MNSRDDRARRLAHRLPQSTGIPARPAGAHRRHPQRWFAHRLLAIVAGLWICGSVPAAFGQEARTLVANTGQATASGATPVLSIQSVAMQFSTGASASPWTMTSIELDVGAWVSGATPTVSLHAASGQSPGAPIATLTNPTAGTGLQAFTVPSDMTVTLQASTTYTVVVESDTTFLNYSGFTLRNTESAAEDAGGATGWQISDTRLTNSGSGWSVSNGNLKLRMAVSGTGGSVSDDATLNSLSLADGSGNAVPLDSTFAAGTTSYTASVGFSVSTLTVSAATTHANATVSISDDDDGTTPGTAELDLGVGANTVTITVTAQDTTTTGTYTVTVTRAAPGATDPRTLVGNTGQSTAGRPVPVFSLQSLAVQFATGDSAERWTLTALQLEVVAWQSGVAPSISLHAASGQNPGAKIATMTNPASGAGLKTFTAPSNVKLQANTTYTVVVESASSSFNGFTLSRTASAAEDGGGASGWGISDTGLSRLGAAWSSGGSDKLKLAVVGIPDSDDATLSMLALADAGDNDIALDPTFTAGTTSYTASVVNSVSTVTVTASANHADGVVSIANDDDDATSGAADLNLVVGENTVTVTVTAQDATTTSTYTVTVTRAAAAPAPSPQTLVGNMGKRQHAAVQVHEGQRRVGIKFTTGDSTTAWALQAIRLHVTEWHSSVTPIVKLRNVSGQWPGRTIATLTNPTPGTGSRAFNAPSGLKLQPNTTYGVVVAAGARQGRFNLGITRSNHEDIGGTAGWSIADSSRSYASGSWSGFPQSLMVAVVGAATSDGTTTSGLTGWFASTPAEHDGSGTFTVRIGFSDPVRISRNAMRDHAVQVSGGSVTTAKRSLGSSDLWDLKIAPAGLDAITVTVEGGRACSATGAVCTSGGSALAETLALTVPGPLALSVADAEANEGTDSAVVFAVSLSRASSGRVTVDYATTDGTAQAGEDYSSTSGTLTFAAGVVEQSVSVPVLDDVTDEGRESFTLTLSNASGAIVGDREATGTIVNSDPMPKAWLTRFGRTVASQAVSTIGARLGGSRGFGIVIGGMAFDGAGNVRDPRDAADRLRDGDFAYRDGQLPGGRAQDMSPRALLPGSEFRFGVGGAVGSDGWTAWGRIASSGFEATQDEIAMDGDVTSTFLGADILRGPWLAGMAVSTSDGDGWFEHIEDGTSGGRREVESRLKSVYPYARLSLSERTDVWAMAGYGTGELRLTERAGDTRPRDVVTETGLSMRMGAVGARGQVLSAPESGGMELALRSDALWVRMESEAVDSQGAGRLAAATGDATRIRLVLEGSRVFELGSGQTFTPSVEVGVRHDGGDAETGAGIEVGAGVGLAGRRFAVTGAVRGLVAHEDGGYGEWGASGSIRISPGATGRGLSLTVAPSWGAASSGVERLWSLADGGRLAGNGDFEPEVRLEAEVGYGLGFGGTNGVVTPYAGLSFVDGGSRAVRSGARWMFGPGASLALEAAHQAANGDHSAANSLALRAEVRW